VSRRWRHGKRRSADAILDMVAAEKKGSCALSVGHFPCQSNSREHRGEAFAACKFIMDYLKTRAPFWTTEEALEGGRWVDARESDDQAAGRWDAKSNNGRPLARPAVPGAPPP